MGELGRSWCSPVWSLGGSLQEDVFGSTNWVVDSWVLTVDAVDEYWLMLFIPRIGDGKEECLSRMLVWVAVGHVGVEVFKGKISLLIAVKVVINLLAPCSDRDGVDGEDHIL